MLKSIALVCGFWLMAGVAAIAASLEDAGTVLAQSGQSFVTSDGQRSALKIGATIHVGDQLEVPARAKIRFRMTDGSIVTAASGTRMTISAYKVNGTQSREVLFSLMSGLLRAVVSVMPQPSHFEVKTATGVAAVRSTDWFIRVGAGSTQVGVLKGIVSLTSASTGRRVDIPARWGTRVEAGRDPVPPRAWDKAEFQDVIDRTDLP
jgi:hypothetical protein